MEGERRPPDPSSQSLSCQAGCESDQRPEPGFRGWLFDHHKGNDPIFHQAFQYSLIGMMECVCCPCGVSPVANFRSDLRVNVESANLKYPRSEAGNLRCV